MMGKIFDAEFRKELYKNLMEAGYEKTEAQRIVGTKYYSALHNDLKETVEQLSKQVNDEVFDGQVDFEKIASKMAELKSLKDVLSKK